ncbi:hypothetical protein [Wolinella succinogenes]|nr:hypothetical protein [Wolinella succinogenes]VEG80787.1 Uncharacterised protein [Wolinella succinogenes]
MSHDFVRLFHAVIIAYALLALSGCGYKDDPFYKPQNTQKVSS